MGSQPIIQARNIVKRFGDQLVLSDVNLDIHEGETLVILGGSGSGKTTLLRMFMGNLRPDSGEIICLGENIAAMDEQRLTQYRRNIGVLFQGAALYNSMTVFDNVALPLREHTDLSEETIRIIVGIKLELVNLREAADQMPAQLSGGMKKRAGLARAMSLDPTMLFYDEPSTGLDPVTAAQIDQLIIDFNRKLGVTGVAVTHEMDSAFRIASRMVLLDRGRFVADGTPDEIKNSADPLVRQFVYGLPEGPLTERRRAGDAYERFLLGGPPDSTGGTTP